VLAKDEKIRPSVTEFFTRVNYGLVLGAFEVDLRDGEARYHISHLVGDGRLEDDAVEHPQTKFICGAPSHQSLLMQTSKLQLFMSF
jgi:hypothetical protein